MAPLMLTEKTRISIAAASNFKIGLLLFIGLNLFRKILYYG